MGNKFKVFCLLLCFCAMFIVGCNKASKSMDDINNKQNEIIKLLEKKDKTLSEGQLKEIELELKKLKEELKILEERYNK